MKARVLCLSLVVFAGLGTGSAQSPQPRQPAYDTAPALLPSSTMGPAHVEVVPFDPKDAGSSKDLIVVATVDPHGHPMNVHVFRGVGMGLDEKAVMAVRQQRFTPAAKNGTPVAAVLYLKVEFGAEPGSTR